MLIFEKFFSQVKNFNSRELDRVSMGITALRMQIPRINNGWHCVELVSAYRQRVAMYSSPPRTVRVSRRRIASLITTLYAKNLVPYVQKASRCAAAHLSQLHQTVCQLSLSEVATAATM